MNGYPVHSCDTPSTVMAVVTVVLAALIVELVLVWGLFSHYINSFEV